MLSLRAAAERYLCAVRAGGDFEADLLPLVPRRARAHHCPRSRCDSISSISRMVLPLD